jgi:hypothetical protein
MGKADELWSGLDDESPCLIWAVDRPSTDVSSDAAATDHRKSFSRGIESVNLDAT